jgi:hypothetical protein
VRHGATTRRSPCNRGSRLHDSCLCSCSKRVCKTVRERSVVKVRRGTVREVIVERPIGRAQTYLNVKWDIPSGARHKRVLLSSIKTADPSSVSPLIDGAPVQDVQTSSDGEEASFGKAGAMAYSDPPPDHRNRLTPTAVVHGQEWFEVEITVPIGGPVIRRRLSCEGSPFATTTVCTFYDDISSQPAMRYHHRKHGLRLPHSVQLVLCRVPV